MSSCSIPDRDLEYHYSPSRWSHRLGPSEVISTHLDTVNAESKLSTWTLDVEAEISYGDTPDQKIDIFYKKDSPKIGEPIFIYIHGGYWQIKEIGRENSSFMAVPLCNAGATVAVVGYDRAPDVSLDAMVLQVKKAVHLLMTLAYERNSSGIYLCGHSAGAHLAVMMMMSAFTEYEACDSKMIKGAMLVSGLYDLRPVVKTSNNDALGLTEEDAWRFSPLNFVRDIYFHSHNRHIIIAVGEYDPPEFRRQSGEMEKLLRDTGLRTSFVPVPDVDHFDVVERMCKPDYILTKECIRLMGL